MKLKDLEKDVEVIITASRNGKVAKFISEVIKPESDKDIEVIKEIVGNRDYAIINLIKIDDKRINFSVDSINYQIICTMDGKSYYWRNPSIVIVNLPSYGDIHIIITKTEGIGFNRRDSFRLWLGQDSIIKFGDNTAPHDAILKDISISGIGLLVKSDYDINIGDKLFVQFKDEYISDTSKEYTSKLYSLEAKVVRIVPRDKRINLVGCNITKGMNEIQKFIVHKQSERLRVGGRKALYNKKKDSELLEYMKD